MQYTLARRLRVLRAERGLTLRGAERLTGVDKDTLSKIERGVRHPHDTTLAKVAQGYGVPVEELIGEPVPLVEAPQDSGPPQASREQLVAEGIPATVDEVEELNYTMAELWRLGRGGKPVAHFVHDDVDTTRVFMLMDLVLDTPSIVTPEAAGVVRQGVREWLAA